MMVTGNETTVHTESEEKPAVHLQIKCRIEKFESLMNSAKPVEDLWSEGVTSELAPRAVWKLRVYPNGNCEQFKGNVSVFLHLTGPMKDSKESLDATFHLFLLDGSGKVDSIGRYTKTFEKEYRSGWDVNHARVKKALHADGSLMVAADIDFFLPDESGAKVIGKNALRNYEDRAQWAAKFFQLYNNQASSDCTIQIGGVSIPAHKSILMAHSPIFYAMFTHKEAEEFQSGTVKITDFKEPEPMRAVVRYCYLGCLDAAAMEDNCALEIFKLADRYCIKGLKSILERHFVEKRLSKENVIALAVLADAHSAPKLKEACIQLIAREGKAVYESADWKEVMKARPELTTQLAVGAATLLATKK